MRRAGRVLCLLLAAALVPVGLFLARELPANPQPYVERKYAGWNGVLRAWVCSGWDCAGAFTRWLNACASDFEKRHDGVYIEFTNVSVDELRALGSQDARPPELVLFSPGILADASMLAQIEAPGAIRDELRNFGDGFAYPVAMGGYIWVYNRATMSGAPEANEVMASPPDDDAHGYACAMVALLSDPLEAEGGAQPEKPGDLGLDLGLPASADAEMEAGFVVAEDALDRFIAGELPCVAVTQAELARLARLRDAGRGPDWACAASGQAAYTDQLLMLGIVAQSGEEAQARRSLAEAFGASLLEPAAQARLADIGVFSVTGNRVHSDFSAYAPLDGLLNSRELLIPPSPWSGVPDGERILRTLTLGKIGPDAALKKLREMLIPAR